MQVERVLSVRTIDMGQIVTNFVHNFVKFVIILRVTSAIQGITNQAQEVAKR